MRLRTRTAPASAESTGQPAPPPKTIPSTVNHQMVRTEERTGGDGYFPICSVVNVPTTNPDRAEFISSRLTGDEHAGLHAPILDLDIPARLVDSGTPGHSHLYLDVPMSWRAYKRLLKALAKAGVVEKTWVKASIRSEATLLRPPWRTKPTRSHP